MYSTKPILWHSYGTYGKNHPIEMILYCRSVYGRVTLKIWTPYKQFKWFITYNYIKCVTSAFPISLFLISICSQNSKQKEVIAVCMPFAYLMVFRFLSTVARNYRYDRIKYNCIAFIVSFYSMYRNVFSYLASNYHLFELML